MLIYLIMKKKKKLFKDNTLLKKAILEKKIISTDLIEIWRLLKITTTIYQKIF